jgi:hypothetical protein
MATALLRRIRLWARSASTVEMVAYQAGAVWLATSALTTGQCLGSAASGRQGSLFHSTVADGAEDDNAFLNVKVDQHKTLEGCLDSPEKFETRMLLQLDMRLLHNPFP